MFHEIIWLEPHNAGMGGPTSDWMGTLYRSMRCIVLNDGRSGDRVLASDAGVLAGDTCSPTLSSVCFGEVPCKT